MIIIKGDINGDGKIDEVDYILMKLSEDGQIILSENSLIASSGLTSIDIQNHIFGHRTITGVVETT